MKKFLTAIALTAVLAPAAIAQQPPSGSRGHHRARAQRIFNQLNLTADQKAQIKAIRGADRQKNQALYSAFRAKIAAYRKLKQANDPKADTVKADLQAMKAQVKAARTATHKEVLSVLTPEQRTQIEQFRPQHRRRH